MVEQNARRALAMSERGYVLDLGANRFEGSGKELLSDAKVTELYLGGGRGRIDAAQGDPASGAAGRLARRPPALVSSYVSAFGVTFLTVSSLPFWNRMMP